MNLPLLCFILPANILATTLQPRKTQSSRIRIFTNENAGQKSRISEMHQLRERKALCPLRQNLKKDPSSPLINAPVSEQEVKEEPVGDNEKPDANGNPVGGGGSGGGGAVSTPAKISLKTGLKKDLGNWRRYHRVSYLYRDRPRRIPYHPNFISWLRAFETGYLRLKQIGTELLKIDLRLSRIPDTEFAHADEEEDQNITVPDSTFCKKPCLLCRREKIMNQLVKHRTWMIETFERALPDFQEYYEHQLEYGMKLQRRKREPRRIALYKSMESSLTDRSRFVSDLIGPTELFADDDSEAPLSS